ncbi:hypothetical protein WJX81_000892 [Elliptochloris bilobata]|uniref:Glycosyltransferase family 92 protein n=1 Tax=Elliptochloris bilobata TaxID=381761 RepID=A0AAW1RLY7_9CHLO
MLPSFREAAVVHVYLKGLHKDGGVALRGYVFAESAVRPWQGWGGGYLCQPHIPGTTWPDLFLQTLRGEKRVLRFRAHHELMFGFNSDEPAPETSDKFRMCVPYPVTLTVSTADAAADFTLHVAGLADYAYFSPGSLHRPLRHQGPVGGDARVQAVLYPFLEHTPQALVNNVLFLYVQYHLQLGYSRFYQYTQSIFVAGFLADERLARLVQAGSLVFILWEGTSWCSGPQHIKCWQPVIYSHAILVSWGMSNVYLTMADHDEYLALPNCAAVGSVQSLVKYCFGQRTAPRLWRYDVFCSTESCRSPADEVALWRANGAGGAHPMQHFTRRKSGPYKNEHGKSFVDPEHGGPFEVHSGLVLPGGHKIEGYLGDMVNPTCGVWLHVINMFVPRDRPDAEPTVLDARWQWALERLDAAEAIGSAARRRGGRSAGNR